MAAHPLVAILAILGCSSLADGLVEGAALSAAGRARQASLVEAWSTDLDAKPLTPVQRVVSLLHKMKAELDSEASSELETYNKLACWCDSNNKEKTRAVAAADAKDVELTAETESRSARFGELATEIAQLKEQVAKDTEALTQATAIRERASAEFRNTEKDLVQAINNLQNAVAVLAKHHSGSLIQLDKPLVAGMNVLLRDLARKYEMLDASSEPERRGHGAALLAVHSVSQGAVSAGRQLVGLLNGEGRSDRESLPLKFAEEVIARSAQPQRGAAFLEASAGQPGDFKAYSSRSSEIFGVLNQMLDEFKASLSSTQSSESKSVQDYTSLAQAKEAEIGAGKRKLDELEGEHASNVKSLADAKEDLANTRKQRAADVEFLQNLKLTCNGLDTQWEQRRETRNAELLAVTETISILTQDESHDLLARSVSFLQVRGSVSVQAAETAVAARRSKAAAALQLAAKAPAFDADDLLSAWRGRGSVPRRRSLGAAAGPRAQLSALALTVQLDAFTKVKEAIDNMVSELQAQQQQEVDFKAYCQKSFSDNENAVYAKNQEKDDLESKVDQLQSMLDRLSKEIDEANSQISETQVAIKKASENREKENAEFQSTVSDQRATQELLRKALARLQDFYKKGLGEEVLVQRTAQTPPAHFNAYKDNSGASPVTGLLEQIIEDSSKLEQEAVTAETQAQVAYEAFVKDSDAIVVQLSESVNTKTKGAAAAKVEKAQAESDHESAVAELGSLGAYEADLHMQCDFVLKNFDIRQQARLQEMEAIQAAKAMLSGAK